ncbi:tetratricopeptide repeat protein [Enterovirga sp.]|jgi:hypothetical protein|uniref:tetratricopeptide repeat protein n=1 Tax=Enterovirga sp. TaxID=2026350 RepID=UPI002630E0E1|nr:tetratricopeptide repeat protein [Enterovirga sp.]MDB5591481.1 exopolysaccharide biosynthesis protein [Enterovirga sp.]
MRISSGPRLLALLWTVAASAAAVPARAADARALPGPLLATESFGSVKEALRLGVRDYNAGNKIGAAKALEYAATHGHALALWKLGRMLAEGDGIPRNDLKAFEYFSRVADENADEAPESPRAGVVANAFVSLGGYFLQGIRGSYVRPNPERAAEMFSYAASYFGDPVAQYQLGRLYLEGSGVDLDQRQAARWLNLAAEKGYGPAQAELGQMLVLGKGVPRQRARGLMWLTLAKEGADTKSEAWIAALHAETFEAATDSERRMASNFVEQFQAKRR